MIQRLLERGTIRPHANELGIDATSSGAVVDAQGEASDRLLAIGPLLKGVLFESVAVPEIRQQALELAQLLLADKAIRENNPG